MVTWHVPAAVTQRDPGDACQFSNCWAAVGVWLVDAATGGAKRPKIKAFKQKVGDTEGGVNPKSGCSKGLEVDLLAGLAAFGVTEVGRPTLDRDEVEELLGQERRRVFAIAVDYAMWPDVKDCSGTDIPPGVNHMVGLLAGLEGGTLQVMNPLCVGADGKPRYQRVPLAAILDCAESFSTRHHRDGIQLVGVRRPTPTDVSAADLELQELREKVADQRVALRRARRIIARALA